MRKKKDIIEDWYDRAGIAQKAHQFTAESFDVRGKWLGIPSIVLSSVIGTSVFASLGQSIEKWHQILVGILSITAAVLAGLQTFMSYPERAERHRIAAAKYGALCRELDLMRINPESAGNDELETHKKELDALAVESPNPPISIYKKAWANWDKWKEVNRSLSMVHHEA